ncbi:hypothetical protein M1P56_35850 (plasmid) [Streptomyces sp. HU2014]|uniref:hypothetical protein n=1 Tax=Streptomyces sp. HU2014 TaxID=2939414 RepID=UPI00200CC732|nr:hypothetical protein [Streptomyces sp. HU2014]UQI49778.1 hypothetical protein M1P56_35850 [Streptomyces sp. HU2014]
MPEIEHTNDEVLNRVPAEFRPLLNLEHLTTWTAARQREHNDDRVTYEAARAMFQAVLRSQEVKGDGPWSARWRARKVEKHLSRLVKASRDAASASEGLRIAYADHVRTVAALPGQRAEKAKAKADRRGRVNNFAAKSLTKTVAAVTARPESDEESSSEIAGQSASKGSGGRTVRGVNDLFDRKGA